jgi:predicted nucleic acid-binding protein
MNGSTVYLDTSSIVKRYIEELGSSLADRIYTKAEAGEHSIVMSLWNVGEALGAFDSYCSRGLINEDAFLDAARRFLAESQKMIRLGSMQILPLSADILVESYILIVKHHIYQADALQIATCRTVKSELFISADRRLLKVAKDENIRALNIETDEDRSDELGSD